MVGYNDKRGFIKIINSIGTGYDLDFYHAITPYFSELGSKVEWRVLKTDNKPVPIALIVPLTVFPTEGEELSYFVITKISPKTACITKYITFDEPQAEEKARSIADLWVLY